MTRPIQAQAPTPERFAAFGKLVQHAATNPTLERGDITFWHDTGDLGGLASNGVTGHLIAHKREMHFHQIERHNHTPEAFIPTRGRSIMVVAPPGALNLANIQAFILEPGCGVLLHTGTWHWAPFPLDEHAEFVLVLRRETPSDDVEIVTIPEHHIQID